MRYSFIYIYIYNINNYIYIYPSFIFLLQSYYEMIKGIQYVHVL